MNRNDRKRLFNASYRYCIISIQSLKDFAETVEQMKSSEEDKIDNLPDSLKDTAQAENISEAIDELSEILDNLESIEDLIYEIAENDGIDCKYIQALHDDGNATVRDGPRNQRFQILLSEQMMYRMRSQAMQRGISCNELICTALQNELTESANA